MDWGFSFGVSPPSHFKGVLTFACQIKLSCNRDVTLVHHFKYLLWWNRTGKMTYFPSISGAMTWIFFRVILPFIYLFIFNLFTFYWRIIALQNFAVFCQTSTWISYQFSPVQSLSCVWLFATPWITAHQASLSITNSWSSLKLMSIKSVMPSSHLILSHPLLLLPPISPSIRVFSNESTLRMRWPK